MGVGITRCSMEGETAGCAVAGPLPYRCLTDHVLQWAALVLEPTQLSDAPSEQYPPFSRELTDSKDGGFSSQGWSSRSPGMLMSKPPLGCGSV